ncbi:biotin--[acetyl-CoA-carboxylase] ligase [Desulfogranum marinum]|uniref:biotin--[acetyl-CoA-carboxylase] ligase n=1 Tax=Desulfogranum marinum TaxID=453220 RepID=UPI0029C797D0|nr:biotin--[acetyl-CoA-carboxylase] ligase [Desulfogranum marinum]
MKILHIDDIASTNSYAKQLIRSTPDEPLLLVAQQQSGGKGQYGRIFSSPKGGLYFTILFQPLLQTKHLPLITLATGVACASCLVAETGLELTLKWPNDIYVAGKKLGGILCESEVVDSNHLPYVIIGVGLNINTTLVDYPSEIQSIVTTVREHTHLTFSLEVLLEKIVGQILDNIRTLSSEPQIVLDQWQDYDYLYRRPVEYVAQQQVVCGTGDGITDSGCYKVIDSQGKLHQIVGGQLRPL